MGAALQATPLPPFPQLVGETSKDLYRLALRLTGDRDEADDLLQATYVRAFESLEAGTFRGDCTVSTWLYRILVHLAFDSKRSHARREKLYDVRSPAAAESSEAAVQLRELRDAMRSLPVD